LHRPFLCIYSKRSTAEMKPKVTFIVPCYKLAHLLRKCVRSILFQTFQDFEVLIMDDCSPDNTPEVAASFRDPRVKHIRNEPNLGHLKNYNKGISLAEGDYIWLISADDSLRSPRVLDRYVELLEHNPNVGFAYCPAIKVVNDQERGVMRYSEISPADTIVNGRKLLLDHLLEMNIIPAPAAMARKKCYEQFGMFPLDLPHAGDWYLWSMFALYFDVGYFAEPMVNRHFHEQNMSSVFYREATLALFENNLAIPLRIQERARSEGFNEIARACTRALAIEYLRQASPPKPGDPVLVFLDDQEFEDSLHHHVFDPREQSAIRAYVYAALADHYYDLNDLARSLRYYGRALQAKPASAKVWLKYVLLRTGGVGTFLRNRISIAKRQLTKN